MYYTRFTERRCRRIAISDSMAIYLIAQLCGFNGGTISAGVAGPPERYCARANGGAVADGAPSANGADGRTAHRPRTVRTGGRQQLFVRPTDDRDNGWRRADKCRMITRLPYPLFDPAVVPNIVPCGFLSVVGNWQFIVSRRCRSVIFFPQLSSVNIRANRPPPWWWFPTRRNWSACEYNIDYVTARRSRHVNMWIFLCSPEILLYINFFSLSLSPVLLPRSRFFIRY